MTPSLRHRSVPDSLIARWDARWKLAAILIAVAGTAALNQPLPVAVACFAGLLLLVLARLPGRWVRDRLALFALSSLPFLLLLPLTLDPAGPGWEIGPVRLSEHGLTAGLAVALLPGHRCIRAGAVGVGPRSPHVGSCPPVAYSGVARAVIPARLPLYFSPR